MYVRSCYVCMCVRVKVNTTLCKIVVTLLMFRILLVVQTSDLLTPLLLSLIIYPLQL